jgi:hypothetical protein
MQFYNDTSLRDITNKDVSVLIVADGGATIETVENCQTFLDRGRLCVDLIPQFNRKYAAPIPDDAIISRNEIELSLARYGVFVCPQSPLGHLACRLLAVKSGAAPRRSPLLRTTASNN